MSEAGKGHPERFRAGVCDVEGEIRRPSLPHHGVSAS